MQQGRPFVNGFVHSPLTFGLGSRQCLGKHLAMYEMKAVLALLLNHFYFEPVPGKSTELELGKFGLFLSAFPQQGVTLKLRRLSAADNTDIPISATANACLVK